MKVKTELNDSKKQIQKTKQGLLQPNASSGDSGTVCVELLSVICSKSPCGNLPFISTTGSEITIAPLRYCNLMISSLQNSIAKPCQTEWSRVRIFYFNSRFQNYTRI